MCSVVVLRQDKLLVLETDADEGEDNEGEDAVDELLSVERMTTARTDVGL